MKPLLRDFLRANLAALLRGRFFQRDGHLPSAGHVVPQGFAGVGVATNADPATDAAVIDLLHGAGIRRVRLDFTYGDGDNHVARFLEALLAADLQVTLHLVQPADAARRMPEPAATDEWRSFVANTLERFGARIELLEAGSTVNRKRWAGYSQEGFLAAWRVVHEETRRRSITLAGPSVTDFEPMWNVGLLALLREHDLLPDLHTDNLFSERCTEPERWDHKILGHALAPLIGVNLIRKARLLQRIGANFGVPRLMSPSAFWTLPRIERLLPDSEQKQADYLSRYLLLCAASGALEAAWWGPLVCHREGLVDDGDFPYPKLERITHYAAVDGRATDFRARPALAALSAFARLICGTHYAGRQPTRTVPLRQRWNTPYFTSLEVHAFRSEQHLIHAAWTPNGRAAAACDVYGAADLAAAEWLDRDGQPLPEPATIFSESPLYLRWPAERKVRTLPDAAALPGLTIHRHVAGLSHYYHRDADWHGMVLAASRSDADRLIAALHPEHIGEPPGKQGSLRYARNAIWTVPDPRQQQLQLVAKKPVKHHLHKKLLDRLKPSKARRSWNGAAEMQRRGLTTAEPVAWFEQRSGEDITRNWYVCKHVTDAIPASNLFGAFARGTPHPSGITPETLFPALAAFIRKLHDRGIHFRDLSGGNILVEHSDNDGFRFQLIDTARIHSYRRGLPRNLRLSDLTRATHKLDHAGREAFLQHYFRTPGQALPPAVRLRFALYDHKAQFKRWLRKTRLYRQLKR